MASTSAGKPSGDANRLLKSFHRKCFHRGWHRARRPGRFETCPCIEIEQLGAKRSGREEVAIPQRGEKLWKIVQSAHDLVRLEWNRMVNNSAVHDRSPRIVE